LTRPSYGVNPDRSVRAKSDVPSQFLTPRQPPKAGWCRFGRSRNSTEADHCRFRLNRLGRRHAAGSTLEDQGLLTRRRAQDGRQPHRPVAHRAMDIALAWLHQVSLQKLARACSDPFHRRQHIVCDCGCLRFAAASGAQGSFWFRGSHWKTWVSSGTAERPQGALDRPPWKHHAAESSDQACASSDCADRSISAGWCGGKARVCLR
jgi:hypothetical protein